MNNIKGSNKKILIPVLLLAAVSAAVFFESPPLPFLRSVFFNFSGPAFEFNSKLLQPSSFFGLVEFPQKKLAEENEELKKEINELSLRLAQFEILKKENADLKISLGFKKEFPSFDFIPARIIGSFRDGRDEFILAAAGTDDGVHSDLWALGPGGVFVGKVVEAYGAVSKVKLITSFSESLGSKILPQNVPVIVRGNGFRELLVELVPENTEVNEGDEIYLREDAKYAGLSPVVGRVSEVRSSSGLVFKIIKALHDYDPNSLDSVFMVKPSSNNH